MPQSLTHSNSSAYRATTANTVYSVETPLLLTKVPDPPLSLNADGAKWWNYYCGLFLEGKILSRMFLTSIENLCIAQQARDIFVDAIQKQGMIITEQVWDNKSGLITKTLINPMWLELKDILIKMSSLLKDMGMTAYTAKVNNFDFSGKLKNTSQARSGPPQVRLSPENLALTPDIE